MTHPESATAIMMNTTRMQRDPDTVNMIGRDAIKPFFITETRVSKIAHYILENTGCIDVH